MSGNLTPFRWTRCPILTPEQLAEQVRAGSLDAYLRERRTAPVRPLATSADDAPPLLSDEAFQALWTRLTA